MIINKDKEYIKELEIETFDLTAKITWLLKEHDLWGDDDTFTFGDGDRWRRFDPEYEIELIKRRKETNVKY